MTEQIVKWNEKPIWITLLLLFFFPLGLYFMWKNRVFSKTTRLVVSIFIGLIIVGSMGDQEKSGAQVRLDEVLEITGNNFSGSCKVGGASGDATISFNEGKVTVNYSAMGYSATESGFLENLELTDDGENNTYRIKGDWNNQDAGNGNFRLEVFGADLPNTIYIEIKGKGSSGWKYYDSKKLSDEDFNKFIAVLKKDVNTPSTSEPDATKEESYYKSTKEEASSELFNDLLSLTQNLNQFEGTAFVSSLDGPCYMVLTSNSTVSNIVKLRYQINNYYQGKVDKVDETHIISELKRKSAKKDGLGLNTTRDYEDIYLYGNVNGFKASINDGAITDHYASGNIWFMIDRVDYELSYVMVTGTSVSFQGSISLEIEDYIKFQELFTDKKLSESQVQAISNNVLEVISEPVEEVEEVVFEESTSEELQYFKIEDPDGYTNMRDAPGGSIIRRVLPNEKFRVTGVLDNYKIVSFDNGETGYIHNSRVVKY